MNQSIDEIVQDTISGNAHYKAWCMVLDILNKVDPDWCENRNQSAAQNVIDWIIKHA